MWIVFAVVAAVLFGIRGIWYQWTSRKPLHPTLLVLGVNVSGALLALAIIVSQGIAWDQTALIGCAMGLFSVGGNLAMLRGFAVGKASLIALMSGLPSLVVVSLSYVIWDERLNVVQLAAFLLIVAGIVTIRYTRDLRSGSMKGFGWGLLTLVLFGLHDISGQYSMKADAPQMWSLFMLFVTAAVFVGVMGVIQKMRARGAVREAAVPGQWSVVRTFATGMMIGLFHMGGTFFLMRAFDIGMTGLVTAVVSMNVVLIIAYAGVFLKERFALKEWIGMLAALVGVVVLSVL
jgi:drug/metabolite transporter (DMT)-like permease